MRNRMVSGSLTHPEPISSSFASCLLTQVSPEIISKINNSKPALSAPDSKGPKLEIRWLSWWWKATMEDQASSCVLLGILEHSTSYRTTNGRTVATLWTSSEFTRGGRNAHTRQMNIRPAPIQTAPLDYLWTELWSGSFIGINKRKPRKSLGIR